MLKSLYFLAIILVPVSSFSQARKDTLTGKLNEYFSALTTLKKFNGNVIVEKKGSVLLSQSYNMELSNERLHVSEDSKFIIASVSKIFIRYSILKLAEGHRLSLTDPINRFITGFPHGDSITIEQLMYHRSGLPRELTGYEDYDSLSLNRVVELAKAEQLQSKPGSQYLYSNVGYFLLHFIINKVAPGGYRTFLQREIFDKYRLSNTNEFNAKGKPSGFAYGFDNQDGRPVPTDIRNINRFETGNFFSTINDLHQFSRQLLSGKYMSLSWATKMFEDSLLVQAGGRPGYRAYFYKNRKTGITFLFLANYTDIPFQKITSDVINLLDGKPYELPHKTDRKKIKIKKETLSPYTGKFELEADKTQYFMVTQADDHLFITDKDGNQTALFPDSETTFFEKPDSEDSYIFSANADNGTFDLIIISSGIKLKTQRVK